MTHKTVGQAALELSQKVPDTLDPVEIQREAHKDWEDHIFACMEKGKKMFPGDFFVVIQLRAEKGITTGNVFRYQFHTNLACPTPNYDQTVYHYHRYKDLLEYLWCIPDRHTSWLFKENALIIADEEKQLLKHILDFDDGTLERLAKKLNNEPEDSPSIILYKKE
jgi:hypothetical protein